MHFCSKFRNCNFNWWWVMACTSSKWGKFWIWSSIWPWRSRSIIPQNNKALNRGLLHLWSKFGDPSLNGWWVIARTNSWLTDTHTHTQATTIPEGQNWPRVKTRSTGACIIFVHMKHSYLFLSILLSTLSPLFLFLLSLYIYIHICVYIHLENHWLIWLKKHHHMWRVLIMPFIV